MPDTTKAPSRSERQTWMAVLARASIDEMEAAIAGVGPLPSYDVIKRPEVATVMVEGRAGGDGRRFNLGEATLTRAVVRLADGTLGFSYALGRDTRKARLAAVLDAMLQNDEVRSRLMTQVIAPLQHTQQTRRETHSRKAAATKVEFYTLMRERE